MATAGSFLVTGGCGFIGSHLADALVARGNRVRVLDDLSTGKRENCPAEAELVVGDVGERTTVADAMAGMDGCFHLAAIASVPKSLADWPGTCRTNLMGSVNVFDAARDGGNGNVLPVVYASSAAVYGDNPNMPLDETAPAQPLTPYGADKAGSELHAAAARHAFQMPAVGMRFFNVYGPRQDPGSPYSGVISIFADRLTAGRPLTLFGDGSQNRDFVFVADVVQALLAAMDRSATAGPVYNVCTGRSTTLLDLIDTLAALTGNTPEIDRQAPRAGDIHTSLGDPTRLNGELGVVADVTLKNGLAALLADAVPAMA